MKLPEGQNPTLMSNIDPSKLSLDQLIANPSLTPEYYSGSLLAEQVASQAKSLATQLRKNRTMGIHSRWIDVGEN